MIIQIVETSDRGIALARCGMMLASRVGCILVVFTMSLLAAPDLITRGIIL